jgi:hypothetical protein
MKCVNHLEAEAEVLCSICKTPICSECRITLRDQDYCRSCLEKQVESVKNIGFRDRSAWLAFLLSLIPGVGYMYLGLMNRGLQTIIIFFGAIFVSEITRLDLAPFVIPVLVFYSIFDTLQLSRKIRQNVPVEDAPLINVGEFSNWQRYVGYALIGLGGLALINNLTPHFFDYGMMHRLISPLLIIGVGVFILYRNIGAGRSESSGKEEI